MNNFMRNVFLVCTLVVFSGCVGGKLSTWGHFHGDLSNQGFQAIDSGFALSSSWISNAYKITSASPVIGKDSQNREVVYIGTSDGMLVAVQVAGKRFREDLILDALEAVETRVGVMAEKLFARDAS